MRAATFALVVGAMLLAPVASAQDPAPDPSDGRAASEQAADDIDACIDAADAAQTQRDRGQLLAARDGFRACAREACPVLIASDCTQWHEEVQALVPSIVARAHDGRGNDLTDVTLGIDEGKPAPVDGHPIDLDPGPHRLRWVHGAEVVEQLVVMRAGEKNRFVNARFGAADSLAPPPPPAPSPAPAADRPVRVPTVSWVLGGVAVLGLASFAGLAVSAQARYDDAAGEGGCAPACGDAVVHPIRNELIAANVALGTGIASALAGVVVAVVANARTPASVALRLGGGEGAAGVHLYGRF